MCCKKLLKNIYQSICGLWFVKLVKRILIPVQSQLLLTIIVICIVVKFFPDKITNFLGIKKDTGEIMSFIELIIEGIFCILVLKEFKMTRKSFKWQQKEQEEKKDKEANRQLNYIIRCFFIDYYNFWVRNFLKINLPNEERKYREWTEEEIEKYRQCSFPDKNKEINYLIGKYKEKSNGEIIIVDDKEEEIIKKIIEKFVIDVIEIEGFARKNVDPRNTKEEKQNFNEFLKNYVIKPELVKTLNIDYKILEKIYYHCLYGKFFN